MATNILLITVDDMNWDSIGAYQCPTPQTTPNIDQLAAGGMRFNNAHVTIAVCQPSRSAMMTGRYPHKSGGEGFYHLRKAGVPILPELLQANGYHVGILGKCAHSTPYESFTWDLEYDMPDLGMGRNPGLYYQYSLDFIKQAQKDNKPFFLMANSHDPHRPFYGNDKEEWYSWDKPKACIPSKIFTPEEVVTPSFLPDLPEVRLEISEYYSSVRRCDDTIGRILSVLEETATVNDTLVIFLSDNGMAFPFAKTNCYLNSTKTPWIMRWPGKIEAGQVDDDNFISGIDMLPTILDAAGVDVPDHVDGQSILPIFSGHKGNDNVFTQFHQTAGKRNYPMRCVQNKQYGYIYNPWSDGKRVFMNESQAGRTMQSMQAAAEQDQTIADRVELFLHRVPEELYNFENDPDGLVNLIENPDCQEFLNELRHDLEQWMITHDDPALEAFQHLHDNSSQAKLMEEYIEIIGGKI